MKKTFHFIGLLALSTAVFAQKEITIADVTGSTFAASMIKAMDPIAGTDMYASISDDGRCVTKHSFRTGEQVATLFDAANTVGATIDEVEGYIMSPDGTKMLIQTNTQRIYRHSFTADYYIYTIASRRLEPLSDGGPQQAPVWSPDGKQVAFVRDNNIYLVKLLYDNAEVEVTKDGSRNEIINGVPDWVNEEEFGFACALTFNADGSFLAWIKYDETAVSTYPLQYFMGDEPAKEQYADYPGVYSYRYPKAGQQNSTVSVWSYEIKTKKTQKLDVPVDVDGYIPRIIPTDDPERVVVFTMNRHQDELDIYTVSPRSTVAQMIIQEKADKYVKEEAMSGIQVVGNNVLLPSDRDGFMRLYIYNVNGQLLRTVDGGPYGIEEIYGYDEKSGDVYYQASSDDVHERQVYVARKNGKVQCLAGDKGWNAAVFSGDYAYFVNTWSDYDTPYVITLRNNNGKIISTLEDNAALKRTIADYGFAKRETFSFTTSEQVKLDGWLLKPADFDPGKKYPVIMYQYGGPGSQQVINSWSSGSMGRGASFDQYLAQQGFIVACVDGRGTGGRGSDFEKCTYLRLGDLEAKDQVEAAIYLASLPYVDGDNIGIWGWSYGGFNTLMSMSEGRPVFKAGVAVAAPTNWKYYDSIYTERYMRTPKENPSGYAINPIERVDAMHGALLLCHGMADDNVHPQNLFEYAEALVQADKDFKENVYTNRNHSIIGGNTRTHLLRQIAQFFMTELR